MFTADVPTYVIDLDRDEAHRWREVIISEKAAAAQLFQEAAGEFDAVPEVLRLKIANLYEGSGGLYRDEMAAWAAALDITPATATMLNCAYELSHVPWPRVLGCTAGVRWLEGRGMIHARNLDWPLKTMGAATRLFRFRRGSREFVSVGVPGQVSVLSGMLPQAYSVTINWAPPTAFPTFDFGPAFLLRHTLENFDNYDEAVDVLSNTPLSTSVFFTVCGTEKDQACIIERTQTAVAVRPLTGEVLAQANDHVAEQFAGNNGDIPADSAADDLFSVSGSRGRAWSLGEALAKLPAASNFDVIASALNIKGVLNGDTCQQMVFCPGSGELKVWRRL